MYFVAPFASSSFVKFFYKFVDNSYVDHFVQLKNKVGSGDPSKNESLA